MTMVDATEVWTAADSTEGTLEAPPIAPVIVLRRPHFMQRPATWRTMGWAVGAVSIMRPPAWRTVGWAVAGVVGATDWSQLRRTRAKPGPISSAPAAAANMKLARGEVQRVLLTWCRGAGSEPRWGAGALRGPEALRSAHEGAMDAGQAAVGIRHAPSLLASAPRLLPWVHEVWAPASWCGSHA